MIRPTYSLRGLLVFVLFCACLCAVFVAFRERARLKTSAIDKVVDSGGGVVFDYEFNRQGHYVEGRRHLRELWMKRVFGGDPFAEVVVLTVGSSIEGVDVPTRFPHVFRVICDRTAVPDATMASWSQLRETVDLSLSETNVSDDALRAWRFHPALRSVCLRDTSITDQGLAHIMTCPAIERIDVSGSRVSQGAVECARKSRPTLAIECVTDW